MSIKFHQAFYFSEDIFWGVKLNICFFSSELSPIFHRPKIPKISIFQQAFNFSKECSSSFENVNLICQALYFSEDLNFNFFEDLDFNFSEDLNSILIVLLFLYRFLVVV